MKYLITLFILTFFISDVFGQKVRGTHRFNYKGYTLQMIRSTPGSNVDVLKDSLVFNKTKDSVFIYYKHDISGDLRYINWDLDKDTIYTEYPLYNPIKKLKRHK